MREEHSKIPDSDPSKHRGILFVHIPFTEYMSLYNNLEFYGVKGEDVCCQALNTGVFAALVEQKIVDWVSVGHDHNNDYYGQVDGIWLAYGRKTGFGCYGPDGMQRGARVFKVSVGDKIDNGYKVETHIRQEDGST